MRGFTFPASKKVKQLLQFSSNGFTLIELIIAVTIIGLLISVGAMTYSDVQKKGRDAKRQSDLKTIQSGLAQFYSDQKYFPPSLGVSIALGLRIYLNKVPTDPTTSSSYGYKPLPDGCHLLTPPTCNNYCLYTKVELPSNAKNDCPATFALPLPNDYGVTQP